MLVRPEVAPAAEPVEEVRLGGRRLRAGALLDFVGRVREAGIALALALLVLVVAVQEPRFVEPDNLEEILLSVSILAIVAVGQTLVVLTRNVDLSVGSMVGLVAFVCADTLKGSPGTSVVLIVLLGMLIGAGLGVVNGLLVSVGRVPAIVATLGTLSIFRGIDFTIAEGQQVNAADVPDAYLSLATGRVLGIPSLILFAAVVVAVATFALRRLRSGRELYAIGSNPEAARLVGVPSGRLVLAAFVVCGALCGLAGVLWGARFATVDARAATGFELTVVAAVVVGGVNIFGGSGTAIGATLGAILLGTIENALSILKLNPFWLQAIQGAVIIAAVTLDALITRRLQRALRRARGRT
jgi:rhamnose transport system permease protein